MILYFLATAANSFKFLHIVPEGLFGELRINIIFFFLIDLIFFSSSSAVGNQLFSL